ncbi:hypothetical protein diail_3406 [Diaporthe ilicicola]|nr:hypothetical protein diail_3406 [Diaporthe ilicicola]
MTSVFSALFTAALQGCDSIKQAPSSILPYWHDKAEIEQMRRNSDPQKMIQAASWQSTIYRYSKDLPHLPIPPKAFKSTQRENPEMRSKGKRYKHADYLKRLLRGEKHTRCPDQRPKACKPWEFRPMSEKQPEQKPGVPAITVTTPEGETVWLQDKNKYNTIYERIRLAGEARREHLSPNSDEHCAAHAEAFAKGLHLKPFGMRPKVLYCCECNELLHLAGIDIGDLNLYG